MPLGLGLGISKIKSLVSGLRVRFQGNATITAALDGILRDLSADFVSNGTVTAALEAIKLLDVDFSGDGTLTGDLAENAYLLDDYSGAAAAYSIRLLSSTYSGALVEIRRSSDNALKSFYPDSNNELSLNSEDGSSTTLSTWIGSDNGFVRTWYDQSGNANDATQTSASLQMKIINSGSILTKNSKPCMFEPAIGSGDFARTLALSGNSSIFSVINTNSGQNGMLGQGESPGKFMGAAQSGNSSATYAGITSVSEFLNGSAATLTRGSLYTALNNTQALYTLIGSFISWTEFNLGYPASTGFSVHNLQEVVIYNSDKTSSRAGIESNQNNYFSIY